MKTIEELWDEAATGRSTIHSGSWGIYFRSTITRFAELVRADCQAVPTESASDVYEACRAATTPYFPHLPAEERDRYRRIVERARTGPPKPKTPGERLREWVNERFGCPSCGVDDWEAEAAKLIGGNDG